VTASATRAPPSVATFVEMSPMEKNSPPASPFATAAPSRARPATASTVATAAVIPSQSRIGPIAPAPLELRPPGSDAASAARPATDTSAPASSRRPSRR
jgi:hypothetical protein